MIYSVFTKKSLPEKDFCGFYFFLIQALPAITFGQNIHGDDSLTHKQIRKLNLEEFRKANQQTFINLGAVNARLDTKLEFDILRGLFSANTGLEDNLGLPGKRTFFTGAFIHRFSPTSGIYAQY